MPERLTCNLRTCQDAKGVYERFFSTLPDGQALPLVEQKMEEWKVKAGTVVEQCGDAVCLPILEIISRINNRP